LLYQLSYSGAHLMVEPFMLSVVDTAAPRREATCGGEASENHPRRMPAPIDTLRGASTDRKTGLEARALRRARYELLRSDVLTATAAQRASPGG
jgi:hypothetical protein